jgi:hypothetical protein
MAPADDLMRLGDDASVGAEQRDRTGFGGGVDRQEQRIMLAGRRGLREDAVGRAQTARTSVTSGT